MLHSFGKLLTIISINKYVPIRAMIDNARVSCTGILYSVPFITSIRTNIFPRQLLLIIISKINSEYQK